MTYYFYYQRASSLDLHHQAGKTLEFDIKIVKTGLEPDSQHLSLKWIDLFVIL